MAGSVEVYMAVLLDMIESHGTVIRTGCVTRLVTGERPNIVCNDIFGTYNCKELRRMLSSELNCSGRSSGSYDKSTCRYW